jgi:conjugal transfer pilus assembly protein TraD
MTSTPPNFPWRPAYEVYSILAWLAAGFCALDGLVRGVIPTGPMWAIGLVATVFVTVRAAQAVTIWKARFSLEGRGPEWITSEEVAQKIRARPGHVWLGWGYQWQRAHAQRLFDLQKIDVAKLTVPLAPLWRRVLGRTAPNRGSPVLHGIETTEADLYVPLSDLYGHIFVAGITGAIKTRLLALVAIQAIRRVPREAVIVIDPKGDTQLRDLLRAECIAAGRAQDYAVFHRAFPKESVRIDTVATWTSTTEIASRIGALIPSESGNDPWSAFGWRILNLVAENFVMTYGERPTLKTLRRYVEGGIDELLHATLVKHFEAEKMDWRHAIAIHMRDAARPGRGGTADNKELVALIAYYQAERGDPSTVGPIDGLISMFQHNREHMQKMLASLIPVLTMLTAGNMAELLSPDRRDPDDPRPILTGGGIADSGIVLYMGLDSLSEAVGAYALASIFLADLAAHAGARFNLGVSEPKVNLYVDESDAAVNVPFIQLLNKGRSAGYNVMFLAQTFPDFIAKLGSEALARQVLGNSNSIVAGRTKDGMTADYVLENFGQTIVSAVQEHQGTNTLASGEVLTYTGSYGNKQTDTPTELVPRDALGSLPDLEFFASFGGRPLVKGRIPLVRAA